MIRSLFATFAALLLLPAAAGAQNLLANPNFDTDVLSWQIADGLTLAFIDNDGFTAPGAAEVTGVVVMPPFPPATGIGQCVDLTGVDRTRTLEVSGAVKPIGYTPFQALAVVVYFDDTACLGNNLSDVQLTGFALQDQWSVLGGALGTLPLDANSASVALILGPASTSPTLETRFDEVFFGFDPDSIFADGYEGGNTTPWTNTVP
ncbi:MAG: hypothetical protein AAGD01_00965 [Acidobacteriota bacterium]